MKKIGFISVIFFMTGLVVMNGCTSLGANPADGDKLAFEISKNFDASTGKFKNQRPQKIGEDAEKNSGFKLFVEWIKGVEGAVPVKNLPEVKPDIAEFMKPSKDVKIIWFGHSSFLLKINDTTILVDPVFSGSAAPVNFMVKRFQAPVLALEELPKIDFVLISHDHYDHLDKQSAAFFKDKPTKFITPLGVGSHLQGWGIQPSRIVEMDWWQSGSFAGTEFIATPAKHFSGRGFNGNQTLWASWIVRSGEHNIYFSGDSGYDTHFKEIGDKYGPFDIAFIESGQYDEKWPDVHMFPEEAIVAYKELRAKKYFPIHWGMFELALHTWWDPVEKLVKLAQNEPVDLVVPKLGQIVYMNEKFELEQWWSDHIVVNKDKLVSVSSKIALESNN